MNNIQLVGLIIPNTDDILHIEQEIVKQVSSYKLVRYTDMICSIVEQVTGTKPTSTLGNTFLGKEWDYVRNERFVDNGEVNISPVTYHLTPMHIYSRMLFLGREIHSNFWVNALMRQFRLRPEGSPPWVVTNVNYPNEADGIINNGGVTIRLDRKQSRKRHPLDTFKTDETFTLDGSDEKARLAATAIKMILENGTGN